MKHLLLISFVAVLVGCAGERDFPEVKKLSDYKETDFVTTPQSTLPKGKNAIYSATMLLAWQEVKATDDNGITVDGKYKELSLLNTSQSFKNTLEDSEFTSESDFDEEAGTLSVSSEFSKSLPFAVKLKSYNDFKFSNEPIKSFGMDAVNSLLHDGVLVLYYKNDNDFIVKLIPSDKEHEVLICMMDQKSGNMQNMFDKVADKIKTGTIDRKLKENFWKYWIQNEGDELRIPKVVFNIETNYKTLGGNSFMLKKQTYSIERAFQRTAFLLDEEGAKVESRSETEVTTEAEPEPIEKPHPKKLHFNKPFLVILKRKDSPNPYFAMWVENTELMQK